MWVLMTGRVIKEGEKIGSDSCKKYHIHSSVAVDPPLREQTGAPSRTNPPLLSPHCLSQAQRPPPAPRDTALVSNDPTSAHFHCIKDPPFLENVQEGFCWAGGSSAEPLFSLYLVSFSSGGNRALFFRELCWEGWNLLLKYQVLSCGKIIVLVQQVEFPPAFTS